MTSHLKFAVDPLGAVEALTTNGYPDPRGLPEFLEARIAEYRQSYDYCLNVGKISMATTLRLQIEAWQRELHAARGGLRAVA